MRCVCCHFHCAAISKLREGGRVSAISELREGGREGEGETTRNAYKSYTTDQHYTVYSSLSCLECQEFVECCILVWLDGFLVV